LYLQDLDGARVDTLACRSKGGDIDGGSRDWARGMKSMMLMAAGGFRMSWYMALGVGFCIRTFVVQCQNVYLQISQVPNGK
jgi:hypothetical protein